jgi:DNA-binding CsgD family transcriptional regulator
MLSPQEKKLFFLLITFEHQKEISNIMGISDSAVSTYQRNIFKKLEIKNRYDLLIRWHSKEKSLAEALKRHDL